MVFPSVFVTVPKTPPPPNRPAAPLGPAAPLVPNVPRARLLAMAPDWGADDDEVFFTAAPPAAPTRPKTTRAAMAIGRRTRMPLAGPDEGHTSPAASPASVSDGPAGRVSF